LEAVSVTARELAKGGVDVLEFALEAREHVRDLF
jgi:hypothetical protein